MTRSYGINERVTTESDIDAAVESLRTLGYAVVDGGYPPETSADFRNVSILHAMSPMPLQAAPRRWRKSTNTNHPYAFRLRQGAAGTPRNPTILEICKRLIGGIPGPVAAERRHQSAGQDL